MSCHRYSVSAVNATTPAIVTQQAARRLPRWVLLLLCMAYVLPGIIGRQPWRDNDLGALGVMLDMAQGSQDWLHPQVLGRPAEVMAWLPYWLGAGAIRLMPFLPADLAARLPFAVLLVLTLACTWYAMFHLARLPAAQPVTFAFGGEAQPVDYARALADAALLALMACLGLPLLSHEATASAAQLACAALLLYACARLASPHAERRWLSAAVWWLGAVGLALSGAPWLGLVLGAGWLAWSWRASPVSDTARWPLWLFCASGTAVAAALAWHLPLPRRVEVWTDLGQWLQADSWHDYGRLLLWFSWPAGPMALWTLWRWRHRLESAHVLLPLWFALAGAASSWLLGANDRALLMALPGLACLAALAIPTLSRSIMALLDWFALLFFTGCGAIIWLYWTAMLTGVPARPAASVSRLVPGFMPTFDMVPAIVAVLATVAWVAILGWRIGRHRPALWKSLVLSAHGSTWCWVLLMTLWLPALNFGLGQEPISRRVAALTPSGSCVLEYGLDQAQITGLQYYGQLRVQRVDTRAAASSCRVLVVEPGAYVTLSRRLDLSQWTLLTHVPRLRENHDHWLVFKRR